MSATAVKRRAARRIEQAKPALRAVPSRPNRLTVSAVTFAAMGIVFVAVLALAGIQAMLVQGQFELDQFDRSIEERREVAEKLQNSIAQMEAPGQVMGVANAEEMVVPPTVVYLEATRPFVGSPSPYNPAQPSPVPSRPAQE